MSTERVSAPSHRAGAGLRAPDLARRLPLLLLPLGGLVAWQAAIWIWSPREWLLPSPAAVAEVMWSDRGRLWHHAQATISEAAVGFALAATIGLALAIAITTSRAAERTLYPWLVASQAIPLLAVAPLVAVWVGYGTAQVTVAFLIAFFPVVVTGVDALRGTDEELGHAARSLGARPSWVWRHVTLPGALPGLFSGLKMAAVFAVTGAVVAEYVGADRGLGYLSEIATGQFQTVLSFAAIVWLAAIGVAFFGIVAVAERLALPHRHHAATPDWRRR